MNGDIMDIDTIAFIIVLFIASCAALYLWINHPRGLIAGEYIERGSLVCLGTDGKVYNAAQHAAPVGFIMECDSDEQ